MRFYISADIEGIVGVVSREHTTRRVSSTSAPETG